MDIAITGLTTGRMPSTWWEWLIAFIPLAVFAFVAIRAARKDRGR